MKTTDSADNKSTTKINKRINTMETKGINITKELKAGTRNYGRFIPNEFTSDIMSELEKKKSYGC